MLKGIPKILSPELLKMLMEMGHGDEIVIADGNFPAASRSRRLVRADGHGATELLEAILKLFPLDEGSESFMAVMQTDDGSVPAVWQLYQECAKKEGYEPELEKIERFQFYERAEKAFGVIATSEGALYANLILKKGVIG